MKQPATAYSRTSYSRPSAQPRAGRNADVAFDAMQGKHGPRRAGSAGVRRALALLLGAALACTAAVPALAASPEPFGDPPVTLAPGQVVALAGPELYVVASGGVGDEERAAIESQAGRYSMRLVFSETNGQYVVADSVSLSKKGEQVFRMNDAGPLLYAQVPPGQYALAVTYRGVTQTRNVTIGNRASDMHLTWPAALD